MNFRITVPFSRYNNDLLLTCDQHKVMSSHCDLFVDRSFVDDQIDGSFNDYTTRFYANFLHRSFVYLITETVGEYPYPYFTEKTWKAMYTGCPFIMINAQHSLSKLHEFGFKTFSEWWDESYDTKNTVSDRIETAVKIVNTLSQLSLQELQSMKQSMSAVISYNQQHLETFKEIELKNIANNI